ncbi:hypothetical protein BDV93DRAFT_560027 [Ceratobasidium sp. AG-I]|nr:hypothetical protein BDV93DRAFT_560027 [Ceratobasidium sp. AG-I]
MNSSPLSLDSFISSVNTSAYSFGSYIKSYQAHFGRLPEEEELNDRFSSEYVLAIQKRYPTYTPIGSIISETTGNPVKHAIETIVQLWAQFEEDRVWHLIYPNQHSERHLGWDFAWIIRLPNGSKRLTFVQDNELQSSVFSLWLKYMVTIFKSGIQVNGLYLLYGIPNCPVSWVTWNEVSDFQRTHKQIEPVTQAVVRLVQRPKMAPLTEKTLSGFVVADGFRDAREDIIMA